MFDLKQENEGDRWSDLLIHSREILYVEDKNCALTLSSCGINIDYSNQKINNQTVDLLLNLAEKCDLREKIHALINGECVNLGENKPALHTALRAPGAIPLLVDDQDIMLGIMDTRKKMQAIVNQIRDQKWLGFSGEPITDIINIGIGGSDLGARLCLQAFRDLACKDLEYHFIADSDPTLFDHVVLKLKPETTLFIVASKSFSTEETLYNTTKALQWIGLKNSKQHFIAVTANITKATNYGIHHVLPIWDWVGGRYSLCSAINLITAIAIGMEHFEQLLAGSHSMDQHFQYVDFKNNLPVMLALIGVWNNNLLKINNLLILTYSQQLTYFMPYIQQLEMESNGKSVDIYGLDVTHSTAPLIWGGSGSQAQHSYYQLLCQGTQRVCADLISLDIFDGEMINDMCFAKIQTLSNGASITAQAEHKIESNVVLSHLRLNDCSPFTLGALVSLYEHKVFVQGVIWNINSFDQPGVEIAKKHRTTAS